MVYMLLGTGFEETEAVTPLDLLRRAGIEVKTVGLNGKTVYGSHRIGIEADLEISQAEEIPEMVILPGGLKGVASILGCPAALDLVKKTWEKGNFVAAICAAPTILSELGITNGKNATCYPGFEDKMAEAHMVSQAAVTDGRLITGASAGCAVPFGLALITALKGAEAAETVKQQIVIR